MTNAIVLFYNGQDGYVKIRMFLYDTTSVLEEHSTFLDYSWLPTLTHKTTPYFINHFYTASY